MAANLTEANVPGLIAIDTELHGFLCQELIGRCLKIQLSWNNLCVLIKMAFIHAMDISGLVAIVSLH